MEQLNPFTLEGKQILVTGASSGIGRSIAILCSKMGAHVILTARNKERLDETLKQLSGTGHLVRAADLTLVDEVSHLVNEMPKLDGIVHCAGVGSRVFCKSITRSDIMEVMDVNFIAPVLLQASILANKKINRSASIVFVSSRAYDFPSVGNAVYSASKGAIMSYSKCLALELAPRLIRVNCICPGMVWTDLICNTLKEEDLKFAEQSYPLKRFGKVEDVANLAVYLLSNGSSWMTGSSIDLSGGGEGLLV